MVISAKGWPQVPSAFRYFLAAPSPEAGAGTRPLVPPEPESPTMALSMLVTVVTLRSAGLAVPAVELPLIVLAAIVASLVLSTTLAWMVAAAETLPEPSKLERVDATSPVSARLRAVISFVAAGELPAKGRQRLVVAS